MFGSSSTPGPNAPLADGCHSSAQPQATAEAAIRQWTAAKWPKDKILLGLPLYGYVSHSSKTTLVGQTGATNRETALTLADAVSAAGQQEVNGGQAGNFLNYAHDRADQRLYAIATVNDTETMLSAHADVGINKSRAALAVATGSGDLSSRYNQQIAFNDLLKLGVLVKSGTDYVATNGYTRGALGLSLILYI